MKRHKNKWLWAGSLLGAALGLVACQDWKDLADVKTGKWNSEWAMPVLDADISLADMISKKKGNLTISEDANGFYTLFYKDEFVSETAETYFSIPNQTLPSISFTSPTSGAVPAGQTINLADQSQTVSFGVAAADQKLRYIDLKAGTLHFDATSSFKHNVSLVISLPSLTKNGTAFSKTYTFTSNGTNTPAALNDAIDLSGYRLDLTGGTASGANQFTYTLKASITTVGSSISSTDKITVNANVSSPKFSYLEGYLGKFTAFSQRDSVFLSIFDSKLAGQVFLEDPKLRMTIQNSFGVGARARITNRIGKANYSADSVLRFYGTDLLNPFDIAAAATRGQVVSSTVEANKTNSNIQGVLNPAPREIIYDASGEINGQTSGQPLTNFVVDTSRIRVKSEVEIPFEGRTMEFYTIHDSSDVTLPQNNNIENVQMNIYANNGFPVEVDAQVYFLDANEMPIDSIFTERGHNGKLFLLDKAVDTDGNGKVDTYEAKKTERQFVMDSARYKFLREKANKIRIFGRFRSDGAENNKSIKIYSYYRLKLKVGVILNMELGG